MAGMKKSEMRALFAKAKAAGAAAGKAAAVVPMVVSQHASPMNDSSPVVKQWHVPDGPCGFAWVTVTPGNCAFANWLKKNGYARKGYYGGVEISISDYGQSIMRKEAHAGAMAGVLQEAGIKAYSNSRMD